MVDTLFSERRGAELAHAYSISGRQADANSALKELLARDNRVFVSKYFIDQVYAGLGDKEQALASLDRAYAEGSAWLEFH